MAACSLGDRNATRLHGVTSQETVTLTFPVVRTSVFVDDVKNCQISRICGDVKIGVVICHLYILVALNNINTCLLSDHLFQKLLGD